MAPSDVLVRLDSSVESDWTVAPTAPRRVLTAEPSGAAQLFDGGRLSDQWRNPLDALEWMCQEVRRSLASRWVGFLSYDLGPWLEPALSPRHPTSLPLFAFAEVNTATQRMESTDDRAVQDRAKVLLAPNFSRPEYESAVGRAIEYVRAGDVFQVNLSQRFVGPAPVDLAGIYQHLRIHRPARYGGLLRFGDLTLICNSPELFLRVSPDGRVLTRPIKGTRPAAAGMEAALRDSAKDQAELNMIVDLERNDLGRVCEIGTVQVSERRMIERHPTVLHGVAGVAGQLRRHVGLVELLRATFPGGSVTGAPKVRAMQIIDELEPCARGAYCGAIGYLAGDGSMQFNIAIRTMIAHRGQLAVPVGGGIVADSDPAGEYVETIVKARAMFEALGIR